MAKPAILKIDIIADAKGVKKGVGEADNALGGLKKAAGNVGKAVALGLVGATVAVGAFAVASIGASSQVEQSFGAVDSVFGKAAAQVKGYASTAATQLGLAKSEYAGLAAVVGSQLQAMGQSQKESAVTTDELIRTGADLAATFGGSVTDAVGAVGSLLRGERDPIEKYGVAIKAADVSARLAATGQDKLTGAALKTAQANATLTLLTEATTNAHGAFGRESNTLAGQQERLRAQFENVKATVGAGLTPVLTSLASYLTTTAGPAVLAVAATLRDNLGPAFRTVGAFIKDTLVPNLRELSTFVQNNSTVFKAFAVVLGLVGAAVLIYTTTMKIVTTATKAYAAVQAILNAVLTANPIGLVVVGLVAIGAALILAYQKSETFRNGVNALFGFLKRLVGFNPLGALQSGLDAVRNAADAVLGKIGDLLGAASRVGSALGGLNPFSAQVATGAPALVGSYGGALRVNPGLTTSALGDSGPSLALLAASPSGAVTVVDQRDQRVSVTVDGALDAPAVARQLERILRDNAVRLGRSASFGLA